MIDEKNFYIKTNGELCTCGFCRTPELIENYEKAISDKTQTWHCHHRLETHFSDGTERPKNAQITVEELKALNMYFNRPPEELIFLTHKEHLRLHNKRNKYALGKHRSEETRRKIGAAHKGKHLSEEHKKKLIESHKGKHISEEHRRKIIEANKNRHLSEETRRKMSEAHKRRPLSDETNISNSKNTKYKKEVINE